MAFLGGKDLFRKIILYENNPIAVIGWERDYQRIYGESSDSTGTSRKPVRTFIFMIAYLKIINPLSVRTNHTQKELT